MSEKKIFEIFMQFFRNKISSKFKRFNKLKFYLLITIFFVFVSHYISKLQIANDGCLIPLPDVVSRAFRPIQSCHFCENVHAIDVVENITPDEFEKLYAYTGRPVLVKDATTNWTASDVFSFEYFRDLYTKTRKHKVTCQFFPYKTEFKNLREALEMDEKRANYISGEPWYFGWSNCEENIGQELRKHYSRPYFLPLDSENNAVDWIFMGGSGLGAHMHIDNVRLPSWQAQIKGSKIWTLAPPPECYYRCSWFTIKVNKGDTIVLDTNKWFHKTSVVEGEISITIGAEYD